MNCALEFLLASDQRIDFPLRRALGQIDGVGLERLRGRDLAIALLVTAAVGFAFAFRLLGASSVMILVGGDFRYSMRNEIDYGEARDALFLKKKVRRRFRLMEHRDQHVAAVDLVA